METQSFADGTLRVTYPDAFDPPTELREAVPGLRDADPLTLAVDDPTALIVGALGEQQFTLVRPLELAPTPGLGGARMASPESATWTVNLDVAADENAVILLDHDGVVSWQLPDRRTESKAPPTRGRADVARSTVTFELTVGDDTSAGGGLRDATGGLLPAIGRLRAHVLKFVAKAVAGQAMTFLERDVQRGLVVIKSHNPVQWELVSTLADVNLPCDRPARILLLVHGTFSSTLGSFAGLAATPEGRDFLEGAISSHDAVIGFDHPTLSRDPMENATDLLTRLQAAQLPVPPTIDVVCYSRGGLVARSLIEYLLPSSTWRANAGRVVFIGATNGGTSMVEPENWREFIDLYTNLAMASTRAIGLIWGSLPIAEIARGVIDGVGALVKYLVAYSIDGGGVPGLAAMKPDGDFVRQINQSQPGQPGSGTPWFVISSDFEPRLVSDDDRLRELPARLIKKLVDGLADQLFGTPNDLVVDTKSMSSIDAETGGFVADSLAFGANGRVYHLAYFIQPEVARALTDWLVGQRGSGVVPPGSVVQANLPRAAQRDIAVVDIDTPVSDVRRRLNSNTTWLVVRNTGGSISRGGGGFDRSSGSFINYPFDREMISTHIQGVPGTRSLNDAINFDDLPGSPIIDIGEVTPQPAIAADDRPPPDTVVVDGGRPIAVIPQPLPPMSLDEMVERPQPPGRPGPAQADRAEDAGDRAHLTAQMPDRVKLGGTVTVTCTLSHEGVIVNAGETFGEIEGFFPRDPNRAVVIQLIPMINAEIVGEGRVSIAMPKSGHVAPLFFDFIPTQLGSCEVWVVARQGELPLLSLSLKAVVEQELSGEPTTRPAEAGVPVAPPAEAERAQVLTIFETVDGNKVRYEYDMFDESLDISTHGVSPDLGDREQYVKGLFAEIEATRLNSQEDANNFLENLQDIGSNLFTQIFPENLQRELWKHRDDLKRLVVRSSEPFIPWELIHLKDPDAAARPQAALFLGQLGLVRWLNLPKVGYLPRTLRRRHGRVRSLCAKYGNRYTSTLAQIEEEEKFLKDKLDATPVDPTAGALRKMLNEGDFDIFHFAGHGLAKQDGSKQTVIQLGDVKQADGNFKGIFFSDDNVRANAELNKDGSGGPLVFLNACQVGQQNIELGSMGGFAHAFLGGGAGAFVSTLWSVGDKLARTFGEEFYKQLLAGETVSAAVRLAREAGRQSPDISWLAYVVYANPSAKLVAPPE
ncbi:DUF7379 domain-containing protein [Candidatus Mycolicibacterium alkanivorans]|uniref:CHAT domain-containing protein n=1 Tax=Candidatus Mycolicibacterium alkanivorans TaxID=2954114 RepID=A0ABS9YSF8_9MYCO|nr:CHAT domain-containing protein [Candidatus Mycolicibacterium alkanivorans]MCI4674166.1 CHAT domain-containing protein [Candidatus Mycolicibacterium alkanivorans]